jgi:hypothetical protein
VSYFAPVLGGGGVAQYDIPGRAFPVEELHLEEALLHTGYECSSPWARDKPLPAEASEGAAAKAAAEAKEAAEVAEAAALAATNARGSAIAASNLAERAAKLANAAAATDAARAVGGVATEWLRSLGEAGAVARFGAGTAATLRRMDLSVVNEELVEALVVRHHETSRGDGGARPVIELGAVAR